MGVGKIMQQLTKNFIPTTMLYWWLIFFRRKNIHTEMPKKSVLPTTVRMWAFKYFSPISTFCHYKFSFGYYGLQSICASYYEMPRITLFCPAWMGVSSWSSSSSAPAPPLPREVSGMWRKLLQCSMITQIYSSGFSSSKWLKNKFNL